MSLTITADVSYGTGVPAVKLVGRAHFGPGDIISIPNNAAITVWRIHSDGARHRVITDADPRLLGGVWAWVDVHCPFNQPVHYEIKTGVYSSVSSTIYCLSKSAWLVSATRADLAVRVDRVKEIGDRSTDTRSGRFEPIGGQAYFLSDGARSNMKGSISIRTDREQAVWDLLADDGMVLINTPGQTGWDLTWEWVQPQGVTFSNPSNLVSYLYRTVDIGFECGVQPDVDLEPLWTSQALLDYCQPLGIDSEDLVSLYADSAALATDTRL